MPTKGSSNGAVIWPLGSGEMVRRIRELDWAKTPLGPIQEWPLSLRISIDIMLASGHAMQLAWGPERTILYNDAYAPMLGDRHPRALGLSFSEAWPDIWTEIELLVERVFAGETVRFEDMPLVMTRHGYAEETWWNFSYSPVRDQTGTVAGLLNVTLDATAKHRAERAENALRRSEERQAFLLKLSDALRLLTDPAEVETIAMRLLAEYLDVMRASYFEIEEDGDTFHLAGRSEREATPMPERMRLSDFSPVLGDSFRSGRTLTVADTSIVGELVAEPGTYEAIGVMAWAAVPLMREGRLAAWIGVHSSTKREWSAADLQALDDVAERTWGASERARAETALRESAARHRYLVGSWAQAVWETDAAGVVVADSPSWRAYTGQTLEEWLGYGWLDAIHPDDRAYAERQWREAVATRSLFNAEFRLRVAEGGWRWVNVLATPVIEADGTIGKWVGMNIDIDARKSAEEARRLADERVLAASEAARMQVTATLESIGDAFYAVDADFRLTYVNAKAETMWGRARETPLGRNLWSEFPRAVGGEPHSRHLVAMRDRRPAHFEGHSPVLDRWMEASLYPDPASGGLACYFRDITERRAAEAALRESEERQAYLLQLNDALSPLADPDTIQNEAMRLLGERLGVSRAQYYTADETGEYLSSSGGYTDGVPAAIGRFRLIEFGKYAYDGFHAGETQVVSDARTDPRISETVLKSYETVGFLAYIGVPFVQRGRFLGTIAVHQVGPREWTDSERIIVQQTAERAGIAVEQARAEFALRKSEERLREFGEASQDVLWIRDAKTLRWVYLTLAFEEIYGISREEALGAHDFHTWTELILPEDRARAVESIARVAAGERVVFEYRVRRPADGEIRWLRNTDFPITDDAGNVTLIGGVGHDITQLKAAEEHQKLLLAELQHRVRNTLAIIRAIARRSAETSETVEDYGMHLDGRIAAFARVQAAVTRDPAAGIDLEGLIADTLQAAHAREGEQATLAGPPLHLVSKAAETIGLALHELTTNALKYGALAVSTGHITVRWSVSPNSEDDQPHILLEWVETGVELDRTEPSREGFGSELLTRTLVYDLNAAVDRTFTRVGVHYVMRIPFSEQIFKM